jgi:hypothetical protein
MIKNFIQIETQTGIKEFELFHGDITDLPFQADLVAISAFKNDYKPIPKSIIGQFKNKGIDIELLSKKPLHDFKDRLGIWVSQKLSNLNLSHIVCVEISGANATFDGAIKNLFSAISIMETNGSKNYSIAIPILGAGAQNINSQIVIPSLIKHSLDFLQHSKYLNKVVFTVYLQKHAEVFNKLMDEVLGRNKIDTPRGALVDLIRAEVIKILDILIDEKKENKVFTDLRGILNKEFKAFEFGAFSRKVLEVIIRDIHPESAKQIDLSRKIESLKTQDIALWMISYMHLIRVFGNEAVHGMANEQRKPEHLTAKDLEVGLHCMQRILEFYQEYKKATTIV